MTLGIDIQHNSIKCYYAQCHWAECRYAECRSAFLIVSLKQLFLLFKKKNTKEKNTEKN